MYGNNTPSRDSKSKGRSFLLFTKGLIIDIGCREASKGYFVGGGTRSYPGSISNRGRETCQMMSCSQQQSFHNKCIHKNVGFLVRETIGEEVSTLSEGFFRLLLTPEKTANLKTPVLVDRLESPLPMFSPNAISFYMA